MLYLLLYTVCETRSHPGGDVVVCAGMVLQISEGSILSAILPNYPIP